jgi:uncharacterized protein YraI
MAVTAAAGRRFILLAVTSITLGLAAFAPALAPAPAYGQEMQQPEVENAKHAFEGRINSNAVYVRSGPSENFYPTVKLDKGVPVTVVGIKFNWLKIEPPKGSFSYVAKAYVQRHGDGSEGTVTENATPNVRAGSDLNAMKTTVQTKLQPGQRVKILGDQDEYFKIEPPAGAYLYVDQRYVDAVRRVGETIAADQPKPKNGGGETAVMPPVENAAVTEAPAPGADAAATNPATTPADAGNALAAGGPATQPAAGAAPAQAPAAIAAKFDDLEAKFKEASGKPLVDQPLEALTAGYSSITGQPGLTKQMQRIADARLAALKVRGEARESYLVLKKGQQEAETKRQALMAEREELQERIKQTDVKVFTAVGTLRTSSLQLGGGTLFRLTDPETGRTVVYLRSADASVSALINQFIGVKGDLSGDPALNLKVINNPTGAEVVDQTKVNGSIAAQVVPPSLLPKIPTASTGGANTGAVEPQ